RGDPGPDALRPRRHAASWPRADEPGVGPDLPLRYRRGRGRRVAPRLAEAARRRAIYLAVSVVGGEGLEPPTLRVSGERSTAELTARAGRHCSPSRRTALTAAG